MPFEFIRQDIEDVILVKPKVFEDNRGFFLESYKKSDFVTNGIDIDLTLEDSVNLFLNEVIDKCKIPF